MVDAERVARLCSRPFLDLPWSELQSGNPQQRQQRQKLKEQEDQQVMDAYLLATWNGQRRLALDVRCRNDLRRRLLPVHVLRARKPALAGQVRAR